MKLGAHDKYATDEGAVVVQASRIFIHPEYNYNTLANDYALIELTSSVAFTDKVWYQAEIALQHTYISYEEAV